MKILIKNAHIISSQSSFNGHFKDLFIDDGIIKEIGENLNYNCDVTINKENLHLSIGWFDFGVNVEFPKNNIENIESISNASAKGGFTEIGVYSSKNNKISSLIDISYFKNIDSIINFYPIASATKNMEGKEINESFRLKNEGAIAFCDNKKEIKNALTLDIILEYNKGIDATTVLFPNNKDLSYNGIVNESENTINTGIKTIPNIAEIINLERDINIAKHTDSKVHFQCISLKKSIESLKNAKKQGVKITAHTTPHHLMFFDKEVLDFNTNAKIIPPLRNKEDNDYLKKAIIEGDIDFISSDHTPVYIEEKSCEFYNAENGTIGLESSFGAINKIFRKELDIEKIVDIMSINPRKIFDLEIPKIEIGEKANITMFNPTKEYIFSEKDVCGNSKNSIFLGKKLKGIAYGVINKDKLILND